MAVQQIAVTRLEPWGAAALQLRMPQMRLAVASLAAMTVLPPPTSVSSVYSSPSPVSCESLTPLCSPTNECTPNLMGTSSALQLSQRNAGFPASQSSSGGGSAVSWALNRVDAGLAVLAAAPPGAEATALQALDGALRVDFVEVLLMNGQQALEHFKVRPILFLYLSFPPYMV